MMVWNVTHTTCGGIAFRLKVRPTQGMALRSGDCVLYNGRNPDPLSRITCESCGSGVEGPKFLVADLSPSRFAVLPPTPAGQSSLL